VRRTKASPWNQGEVGERSEPGEDHCSHFRHCLQSIPSVRLSPDSSPFTKGSLAGVRRSKASPWDQGEVGERSEPGGDHCWHFRQYLQSIPSVRLSPDSSPFTKGSLAGVLCVNSSPWSSRGALRGCGEKRSAAGAALLGGYIVITWMRRMQPGTQRGFR